MVPPPLELDDRLRDAVMTVLRSVLSTMRENFRRAGLSPPQFWVLQMVESDGPLTTGEVTRRLCVKLPTTSGLVDGLVDQGLVARSRSPTDRRVVLVGLTPRGRAQLRSLNERFNSSWRGSIARIDARRRQQILRSMRELGEVLQEPARPAPRPRRASPAAHPADRTRRPMEVIA